MDDILLETNCSITCMILVLYPVMLTLKFCLIHRQDLNMGSVIKHAYFMFMVYFEYNITYWGRKFLLENIFIQ